MQVPRFPGEGDLEAYPEELGEITQVHVPLMDKPAWIPSDSDNNPCMANGENLHPNGIRLAILAIGQYEEPLLYICTKRETYYHC